ncbi:hypothetical protein WH82_16140 [Parageobacillus thermoglucosidasius]|nr:hypothetical protein WH82_16140 [Parageobacillus thermoglucosidasius]
MIAFKIMIISIASIPFPSQYRLFSAKINAAFIRIREILFIVDPIFQKWQWRFFGDEPRPWRKRKLKIVNLYTNFFA